MSCDWVINQSVVNQINANNSNIQEYNTAIGKLTSLTSEISNCSSYVDCCYNNLVLAISGSSITGAFDKINSYKLELSKELSNCESVISEMKNAITKLENENAKLEQNKYTKVCTEDKVVSV